MKRIRQMGWIAALAAGLAWSAPGVAQAAQQGYPSRPIQLVVPYAPGGTTDALGRILAEKLQSLLGRPVVVENLSGAGSSIGAARVAQATPDGHTLLFNNMAQALVGAQYKKLPYDPIDSFEPVGLVAYLPMLLEARADFPARDLDELVAYIRKNHARMSIANGGVAGSTHLCALMIMDAIGVEMTHVPYKGAGPALVDLVGGSVDLICDSPGSSTELIKSGKLRGYALTDKTRAATLPDIPTFEEQGYPDMQLLLWHGVYAPKGTPPEVVSVLTQALQQTMADESVRDRLAALSITPEAVEDINPEALRQRIRSESQRWSPLIEQAIGR